MALDSLIYTLVYVPIREMRKYRFRALLLSEKVAQLSNHSHPSYKIHRKKKVKLKLLKTASAKKKFFIWA